MARVLLVEDVPNNREIYRTILEHAGHTVVEAVNGAAGIELARSESPDVIVMDVTMPLMDGLEATRRLKADRGTAGIPVLILTAHAYDSDREDAMRAGADAYLAKPCPPRTVVQEVERLVGA
ncbi:MAG: response regulator [Gemmatimonadetes bacterium]|nr:response regulator [Gemmatimonadota bacterium]